MTIKISNKLFVFLILLSVLLAACSSAAETETAQSAAQAGQALFQKDILSAKPGCKTCHSLEPGVTIVGPSMAGIASRAGEQGSGLSAQEYLRQSILDPDAYLVSGFPAGTMPQGLADELSAEQVDQLVAYLMTLE